MTPDLEAMLARAKEAKDRATKSEQLRSECMDEDGDDPHPVCMSCGTDAMYDFECDEAGAYCNDCAHVVSSDTVQLTADVLALVAEVRRMQLAEAAAIDDEQDRAAAIALLFRVARVAWCTEDDLCDEAGNGDGYESEPPVYFRDPKAADALVRKIVELRKRCGEWPIAEPVER